MIPLKKKLDKNDIRPIGVPEPLYKVIGLLWLDKTDANTKRLLRGIQFGGNFAAGAEALARLFQLEIDKLPHGTIMKLDLRNFFNTLCRQMIVDGAALVDPHFAQYVAGLYAGKTTYVLDQKDADVRKFFETLLGTVQGDVLSARLAALAILPAQRKFFSLMREKYPEAQISAGPPPDDEGKIGAVCTDRLRAQDLEEIRKLMSSMPSMKEILEEENKQIGSSSCCLKPEHVHISLRAFVDDQTAKIPHLLVDKSEELLSILFRSTKTEFNHSKTLRWNINGDPTGGVIAVGLALWGPEPDFFYRIGSQTFLEKLKEQEVIDAHQRQLDALLKVLEKAPSGRDVGTGIERVLRFCICTKHTHVARALPPQLSEPMLQKCHEMTLDFIERLLNWTNSSFWNNAHRKLVRWNLELRLKDGGTGCLPLWRLAKAAYAASWYQPLSTIAIAAGKTELEVLQEWNANAGSPTMQILKNVLKCLGYKDDFLEPYHKFQAAIEERIQSKCQNLPVDISALERKDAEWEIRNDVISSFKWQRFFSGDTLQKHAEKYEHAVARSKLPFSEYDVERIKDRKDPFAAKIFQTSLWENRTRLSLEDFRLSRSYFFGVFIREPKNSDGSLRMYPCYLTNEQGKVCSKQCDPFGHHAHLCDTTNKTIDHNYARDIIKSMGGAIGFVTDKEVVVCPWEKKPDVELKDPSGELLTLYLDITLPALHQEAIKSRTAVFKNARLVKNRSYPRKDQNGRLLTESSCIPFILTSMGGLCDEGHEFLRLCRKRSPDKTKHLIDVLVTQHAKWIASRLRRALFGQSTSSAVASQRSAQLTKPAWKATSAISTAQRTQNNCGHMKRLKAAFSNFPCSEEATKVGTNVGQNGGVFPPSPQ